MPKIPSLRHPALLLSLSLAAALGGCQSTSSNPYRFERAAQSAAASPAQTGESAALQLLLPQRLVEQRSPALKPQLLQLARQLATSREQTVVTIVTSSRADFEYLKGLMQQSARASQTLRYELREQPGAAHSLILINPA